MDFGQFGSKMKRIAKNVPAQADKLTRMIGLSVDAAVVLATPVDEGRARSNWQVQIGDSAQDSIAPYDPGFEGSTGAANARHAIEQGKQAISTYKSGSSIHITNNLDYISPLNNGSSPQADPGFVQESILIGVKQATRKFNKIIVST